MTAQGASANKLIKSIFIWEENYKQIQVFYENMTKSALH